MRKKKAKDAFIKILLCLVFISITGFIFYDFFLKPKEQAYTLPKSLITPTPSNEMIGLLNEVRTMNDLTPLREDQRLNKSAKRKACDMRDKGYFEHTDPGGAFAWHMFKEEGYEYTEAGENLVQYTDKPIIDMFYLMASPEHRDVILDPVYRDVGIGVCGDYLVQHYGSTEPVNEEKE